jgi:hypothetical protein
MFTLTELTPVLGVDDSARDIAQYPGRYRDRDTLVEDGLNTEQQLEHRCGLRATIRKRQSGCRKVLAHLLIANICKLLRRNPALASKYCKLMLVYEQIERAERIQVAQLHQDNKEDTEMARRADRKARAC